MMMRLSADRPAATLLWKDEGSDRILVDGVEIAEADGLHSNITTPLIVGDYIYGIGSHGHVRALRADTGERVWEAEGLTTAGRWGSAHFVRHENRYFVYNENGELIIARFTPEGYVELDRTHLIAPTSRTGYGLSRPGSRSRRRHGAAIASSSGPIRPSPTGTSFCGTTRSRRALRRRAGLRRTPSPRTAGRSTSKTTPRGW